MAWCVGCDLRMGEMAKVYDVSVSAIMRMESTSVSKASLNGEV